MRYLYIEKPQRVEISGEYPKRALRIIEEFEKANLPYDIIYSNDIKLYFAGDTLEISVAGKDILKYSHIIFGGHHLHRQSDYEIKRIIVEHVEAYNVANKDNPIRIQNAKFIKKMAFYSKLYMTKMCLDADLPYLASYYDRSGGYKDEAPPFPYPMIVKHQRGVNEIAMIDGKRRVKKNVFKVDNESDWGQDRLVSKRLSNFFIQEFADSGEDFRFFVSKGRIVGGWKRVAGDTFMTVNRREGSQYLYENDPAKEIHDICQRATDAWGVDFMALDFIYKDGKPYILEYSMHPGFDAYENKCEGGEPANIAKAIIESF